MYTSWFNRFQRTRTYCVGKELGEGAAEDRGPGRAAVHRGQQVRPRQGSPRASGRGRAVRELDRRAALPDVRQARQGHRPALHRALQTCAYVPLASRFLSRALLFFSSLFFLTLTSAPSSLVHLAYIYEYTNYLLPTATLPTKSSGILLRTNTSIVLLYSCEHSQL